MRPLRAFLMGLKTVFHKDQRNRELDEELRDYLEASAQEKMRRGMTHSDAMRASRAEMGTMETVKEKVHAAGWESFVESIWQDIRYGLRQLIKSPAFTLTAVLTLALGIGANTAIFTLVHAVMLKQLPIASPNQLYRIGEGEYYCCEWGGLEGSWGTFDYPYYKHLRDTNPAFEQLAAFAGGGSSYNVRRTGSTGAAQTTTGEYVSGNYFSTLGIRASLGRLLNPSDDKPESAAAAVMGYSAWRDHYGADPSMIGSTILVNGLPVTLVGIAPEGFFGDRLSANPPELWIPLNQEPAFEGEGQKSILNSSGDAWLYIIGRLKPGVSPTQLQTQLSTDLRQWLQSERHLSKDDLAELPKQHIQITPCGTGISPFRSNSKNGLYLLSAASVLVLLIACANLANLLLARSAARSQQTALRLSLGASRSRLIRAALTESVLLSVIGGAAGLLFAFAGTKAILLIVFRGAKYVPVQATPSLPILSFALLVSVLTGIIFGIAPAWIGTHADPQEGLRGSSRSATARSSSPQKILVIVQAALSIILLAVAGLVTQSLRNLEKTNLGFQSQGRLLATINFKAAGYKPDQLPALYEALQNRLEQIPGVRSASLSLNSPQNLCCVNLNITIGGRTDKWIEDVNIIYNRVSPHYFETIGTPLLRGRVINERDTQGSQHVAVVDESFARKFFPGEDAIGKSFGILLPGHGYDYQIVGIVKDAIYKNPSVEQSPALFLPFTQTTEFGPTGHQRLETGTLYAQVIQLNVVGVPESYEKSFLRALASVDPNLSVDTIMTYSELVAVRFNQERLIARLTGLFSLLALMLASIGLYGVTAYNVTRRTNEIGTRMALGASRGNIVSMVLRSAFSQVIIGLCIGLPLAILIGRYLAHQLYEVGRFDPLVLGGATVILCICTLIAGLFPARRAASIEPMEALRIE
jgi:predicted permease